MLDVLENRSASYWPVEGPAARTQLHATLAEQLGQRHTALARHLELWRGEHEALLNQLYA